MVPEAQQAEAVLGAAQVVRRRQLGGANVGGRPRSGRGGAWRRCRTKREGGRARRGSAAWAPRRPNRLSASRKAQRVGGGAAEQQDEVLDEQDARRARRAGPAIVTTAMENQGHSVKQVQALLGLEDDGDKGEDEAEYWR